MWLRKLRRKRGDDFLPQLTVAADQPASCRLIIGWSFTTGSNFTFSRTKVTELLPNRNMHRNQFGWGKCRDFMFVVRSKHWSARTHTCLRVSVYVLWRQPACHITLALVFANIGPSLCRDNSDLQSQTHSEEFLLHKHKELSSFGQRHLVKL